MSPTKPSFFVTGGTVPLDAASYLERSADRELLETLRGGEYCFVLNARQMGKSSLSVRVVEQLNKQGIRTVFVDLQKFGGANANPEQWYASLLSEVGRALGLRKELLVYWQENSELTLVHRFFRALREVALENISQPLVVFVDEIDATRSLPFSTDEFFAAMREFYNQRVQDPASRRITFCLVGSALPSDLIKDRRTSPFNIGERIELRDFTADEVLPLADGLNRPNAAALLQRIYYWTNGHPYLTQSLCAEIAADETVQTPKDVDRMVDQLFFEAQARERNVNLADVATRMLSHSSEGHPEEEFRTQILDLYRKMLRGQKVVDDEADRRVAILKLSGITRAVEGYLQVRNRIYERVFDRQWIAEQMPDAELRRQKAAYRRGMLRTSSIAAVVLAVVGVLALTAFVQFRRAEHNRQEAETGWQLAQVQEKQTRQNLVRMHVATGLRLVDNKRLFQALLWFAEALRLDPEPQNEAMHRMRFATTLRQCPRLVKVWPGVSVATFTSEGMRVVTAQEKTVQEWDTTNGEPIGKPIHHPGEVLALSPDGKRVLIALSDGSVQVRKAVTGQPVSSPFPCRGKVAADTLPPAFFSEDGRRVLRRSDEDIVEVWDAETGDPLLSPREGKMGQFSPKGRRVAITNGSFVQVWDLSSGEAFPPLSHGAGVLGTAFRSDGNQVVTYGYSDAVRVWDVESGQVNRVLISEGDWFVVGASFSPDGRRLVTGGQSAAQVWDLATGRRIPPPLEHRSQINQVEFSPDGLYVLTGSHDETVRVWDATTGQPVSPALQQDGMDYLARFGPEGRCVLTGGSQLKDGSFENREDTLQLWDLATCDLALSPLLHRAAVWVVCLSPHGDRVATASADGTVRVWDTATGQPTTAVLPHLTEVWDARFSPDGGCLVTASGGGSVRVWDATTGQPITPLLRHPYEVVYAEFSPDGRSVVTASGSGRFGTEKEGAARVWDAETGKLIRLLKSPYGISQARFSPDGRRVAIAGGQYGSPLKEAQQARVWDIASGQPVTPPLQHGNMVNGIAFSPDGRCLVTAGGDDFTARVWAAATGEQLQVLKHNHSVLRASFNQNGSRIVTACYEGTAQVWDTSTGQRIAAPLLHQGPVDSASFSPDGQRVVTASRDNTVRVWDAATGQPLTPPLYHRDDVNQALFTPDGGKVVAACLDGTAQIWEVSEDPRPPEDLQHLAQVLAGGQLQATSGTSSIQTEKRNQAWQNLRKKYPEDFSSTPVSRQVWQLRQARRSLKGQQWSAALDHYHSLLPTYPTPGSLLAERAGAYAELGQWKEARADYVQSNSPEQFDLFDGYRLALTQLMEGDVGGYRRTWGHLRDRWDSAEDPWRTALVLWVGVLAPQPQVDPAYLVSLGEKVVGDIPENGDALALLSTALYRAGRNDKAIQQGRESQAMRDTGKVEVDIQGPGFKESRALRMAGEIGVDKFLLALAHHRQGQRKEARRWLGQTERAMAQQAQREAKGEKPLPWEIRAAYHILHREVEAVLEGK